MYNANDKHNNDCFSSVEAQIKQENLLIEQGVNRIIGKKKVKKQKKKTNRRAVKLLTDECFLFIVSRSFFFPL